jgi:hypothetical protein
VTHDGEDTKRGFSDDDERLDRVDPGVHEQVHQHPGRPAWRSRGGFAHGPGGVMAVWDAETRLPPTAEPRQSLGQ